MKVLFVSLYAATPHFETELELMADHLRDGHEVHVLRCTGQLVSCLANPTHRSSICTRCLSAIDRGLEKLASPRLHVHALEPSPVDPRLDREFADVHELKHFELDGVNLGRGACSTVCSMIDKDVRLDTRQHAAQISRELHAAHQVLTATSRVIARVQPERVYVFNGRFATMWAIVLAARQVGVDFYAHERGATAAHYLVRRNELPHELATAQDEMLELWRRKKPDRERLASDWFEGRRSGSEAAWLSFTKTQHVGELPSGFDRTRHNIAIFNSTMEEYDAVDCWNNPIYPDEVVGLRHIAEAFATRPDVRMYLRVHPNLKNIPRERNYQLRAYAELERAVPNLTVIWPESVVHTYALMEASNVVLTFGSTMGVESAFWGKPSICAGRSLYEHLGCAYIPTSPDELVGWLADAGLPARARETALPYGYWEATKGTRYLRFRPTGLFTGEFEGEVVRPSWSARWIARATALVGR